MLLSKHGVLFVFISSICSCSREKMVNRNATLSLAQFEKKLCSIAIKDAQLSYRSSQHKSKMSDIFEIYCKEEAQKYARITFPLEWSQFIQEEWSEKVTLLFKMWWPVTCYDPLVELGDQIDTIAAIARHLPLAEETLDELRSLFQQNLFKNKHLEFYSSHLDHFECEDWSVERLEIILESWIEHLDLTDSHMRTATRDAAIPYDFVETIHATFEYFSEMLHERLHQYEHKIFLEPTNKKAMIVDGEDGNISFNAKSHMDASIMTCFDSIKEYIAEAGLVFSDRIKACVESKELEFVLNDFSFVDPIAILKQAWKIASGEEMVNFDRENLLILENTLKLIGRGEQALLTVDGEDEINSSISLFNNVLRSNHEHWMYSLSFCKFIENLNSFIVCDEHATAPMIPDFVDGKIVQEYKSLVDKLILWKTISLDDID